MKIIFFYKILEHTPIDHPDKQYLQEAFTKADEFCKQVDTATNKLTNISFNLNFFKLNCIENFKHFRLQQIILNSIFWKIFKT